MFNKTIRALVLLRSKLAITLITLRKKSVELTNMTNNLYIGNKLYIGNNTCEISYCP